MRFPQVHRDEDPILAEVRWEALAGVNRAVALILFAFIILDLATWAMADMGLLGDQNRLSAFSAEVLAVAIAAKAVALGAYLVLKGRSEYLFKYVAIAALMLQCYILTVYMSHSLMVSFVLPALITALYSDRRTYVVVVLLGACVMLYSLWMSDKVSSLVIGVFYGMTWFDRLVILMKVYYMFNLVVYLAIAVVAYFIASNGIRDMERTSRMKGQAAVVSRDLQIASEIQSGMLPSKMPESAGYTVRASMIPAKEVGGDFYDCIGLADGRLLVLIADVSGKGVSASLFMAGAISALKSAVSTSSDLVTAVTMANEQMVGMNPKKYFVTLWVGVLDPGNGRLTYVNAGHNPPFIVSDDGARLLKSKPDFVFGRKKNIKYNIQEAVLDPGSRLYLYTDGVTEAKSESGGMYGEERLAALLASTVSSTADEVLSAVKADTSAFAGKAPQSDDMTMVVVDYHGATGIVVKADRDGFGRVMEHLGSFLAGTGCSDKAAKDMKVVCSEVFANIDMYGFAGREKGTVVFRTSCTDGKMHIEFEDDGIQFNPLERVDKAVSDDVRSYRNGGLGIIMVGKLTDGLEYEYRNQRNVLKITKEI